MLHFMHMLQTIIKLTIVDTYTKNFTQHDLVMLAYLTQAHMSKYSNVTI